MSRGHEVEYLTGLPNYPSGRFFKGYSFLGPYQEDRNGVRILRVPLIPRFAGRGWNLILNYLSFAFTATLGIFSRASRADAILIYEPSPVTQGIPAVLFGRARGIPVLFWVQDLWPESLTATGAIHNSFALGLVRRMVHWLYHRSNAILVQSRSFMDAIREYGIPDSRIRYYPNTAEDFYMPIAPSQIPDPISSVPLGFRVMFAGNIGKAQDFPTILGAAEKLKGETSIQFVIVGDGRDREWMQSEITRRSLGTSVHWVGSHPAEKMPHYFAHADAMLVTLRDEPPFAQTIPAKIQSYMACEKPIIASLPGEGAKIVEEAGAGISCRPQNPDALASAVLAMSRMSASERAAMGKRGGEYFKREFSSDSQVEKLEKWIAEFRNGANR